MVLLATMTAAAAQSGERPDEMQNIARGARYTMSPHPDYPHCTDPGDATQLTDGQLTEGHFWTQKGTVGWQGAPYVSITVDLGEVEPIGGVSFRTAAGVAGVSWPAAIRIHVGEDGKTFRDMGDLLELDDVGGALPTEYAVRRFATTKLKARGRYVRFLVLPCGPYVFADEVEVLRGPDSLLRAEPVGEPAGTPGEYVERYRVESGIRRRFVADMDAAEKTVRGSSVDAAVKKELLGRLSGIREGLLATAKAPPKSFRAVLPFNEKHAEVFRVQAALWRASGLPALSAWSASQWDPMDPFAMPTSRPGAAVTVHTMRGEYRSAAFNLANATDKPMQVSVRFAGLPGAPAPAYVTVQAVPWTDTVTGQLVAAALPEAPREGDAWRVEVLPGLVRQVWLTFHVTDLPAGEQAGAVAIAPDGERALSIPIRLQVYPLSFPAKTTLCVGGWSYTDGEGTYGITPQNHKALVEHLRSRFVNAPWATAQVMMQFTFKDGEPPTVELDTRRFDDWLTQWPGCRAYFVFASVGKTFAGTRMGTVAFNQRVGAWISAWVRHLKGKGIQPDQLGLLLVDEPRAHESDDVIIPWARAIRAAEPRVLIWEDPIYKNPKEGRPEMFELSHILCPNRPMWLAGGKPFEEFYLDQQKRGRTLQFYSCSGPARLLDPYSYYRLQAWHCWHIRATGSFFWAFGDTSRASSWNEYTAVAGPYTPLFIDDQSVTSAKPMEAIRESVEDYEYFVMLREAIEQASKRTDASIPSGALSRAGSLVNAAADEVLTAEGADRLTWYTPKDRTKADAVRVHLLEALTALTSK
jgi:hypothetical protein